ncbi:hypothetical protein MP638_006538 [Amoeboaphelidium occidentale]|nr:hypothetical protein MP638_006538 [Amoeboaphelidium occidentale]
MKFIQAITIAIHAFAVINCLDGVQNIQLGGKFSAVSILRSDFPSNSVVTSNRVYVLDKNGRKSTLLGSANGEIHATGSLNGDIYAGGNFSSFNGNEDLKGLVKIRGNSVSNLNIDGSVNLMSRISDILAIGGSFISDTTFNLAETSGGDLLPFRGVSFDGPVSQIYNLEADDKYLILGGFDNIYWGQLPLFPLGPGKISQVSVLAPTPRFLRTEALLCGQEAIIVSQPTTLNMVFKTSQTITYIEIDSVGLDGFTSGSLTLISSDGTPCTQCPTLGLKSIYRVMPGSVDTISTLQFTFLPKVGSKVSAVQNIRGYTNTLEMTTYSDDTVFCPNFNRGVTYTTSNDGEFNTQRTFITKRGSLASVTYSITASKAKSVYTISMIVPSCIQSGDCDSRGNVKVLIGSREFTLNQAVQSESKIVLFQGVIESSLVIKLSSTKQDQRLYTPAIKVVGVPVRRSLKNAVVYKHLQDPLKAPESLYYPDADRNVSFSDSFASVALDPRVNVAFVKGSKIAADGSIVLVGNFPGGILKVGSVTSPTVTGQVYGIEKVSDGFVIIGEMPTLGNIAVLNKDGNSVRKIDSLALDGIASKIAKESDILYIFGGFRYASNVLSPGYVKLDYIAKKFEPASAVTGSVSSVSIDSNILAIAGYSLQIYDTVSPSLAKINVEGSNDVKDYSLSENSRVDVYLQSASDKSIVGGFNFTGSGQNEIALVSGSSLEVLTAAPGEVLALTLDRNGRVVAVGEFSSAEVINTDTKEVIKYKMDGPALSAVSLKNGNVVISGSFSSVDDKSCLRLCLWTGNEWNSVSNNLERTLSVETMTAKDNNIYFSRGNSSDVFLLDTESGEITTFAKVGAGFQVEELFFSDQLYIGCKRGDKLAVFVSSSSGSVSEIGSDLSSGNASAVLSGFVKSSGGQLLAYGKFYGSNTSPHHVSVLEGDKWSPLISAYDIRGDAVVRNVYTTPAVNRFPLWLIILIAVLSVLFLVAVGILGFVWYKKREGKTEDDNLPFDAKMDTEKGVVAKQRLFSGSAADVIDIPILTAGANVMSDPEMEKLDEDSSLQISSGNDSGSADYALTPSPVSNPATPFQDFDSSRSISPVLMGAGVVGIAATQGDAFARATAAPLPDSISSEGSITSMSSRSVKSFSIASNGSDINQTLAAYPYDEVERSLSLPIIASKPDSGFREDESNPRMAYSDNVLQARGKTEWLEQTDFFNVISTSDFNGESKFGELQFRKGQRIRVLDSSDGECWLGELISPLEMGGPKRGLFPSTLVEQETDEDVM